MVFLKEFFQKVDFEKKISRQQKSVKNYLVCYELSYLSNTLLIWYTTNLKLAQNRILLSTINIICRKKCKKRRSRMTKTGSNLNLVHRKIYILSYPYQNWMFFTSEIEAGHILFEPCNENWLLAYHAKTKTQISCAVTAQLISAFVFAT